MERGTVPRPRREDQSALHGAIEERRGSRPSWTGGAAAESPRPLVRRRDGASREAPPPGADAGDDVTRRPDATLNRGVVRPGSPEIYTVVEAFDAIADALVVGAELADGEYLLALFVVPADGAALDDTLRAELAAAIRSQLSPRHVPDDLVLAPAIPRTLTGKRLEVPVKRILQGAPVAQVAAAGAVDRPDVLEWYADYAGRRVQAGTAS
jgi:hypothetical protein